MEYNLLSKISGPDDVKSLSGDELTRLCDEIRDIIIDTVSKNGGHLASNLGAVELTVALHRVFSTPEDAIIFDVGHQCYTHKLLTGRFDRFSTIRTKDGLSGFMRPDESEHDAFVTGHSSNSISAAYGIYKAKALSGQKGTAVAVIGDGAMTGGMAYEALNNAGAENSNFIVVLNDNKMSISHNVGAMSRIFSKLRSRPKYHSFKFALNKILFKIPLIGRPIYNFLLHIKEIIKGAVYRNNIFASLGFNYLGPVSGHDIKHMEELFKIAKNYNRPCLIHVVTTKGKGYPYAENKPNNYHGVSPFDIVNGADFEGKVDFSAVAGGALCKIAEENNKVCAVTAAMTSGTGLTEFSKKFGDRFFDVGIAEQHAVTFTAGLAKGGAVPFFAVYSSFLQRGYDQIIHDAAIARLPIKLLVDRAGIVGEDGESHQGIFDVAYLTTIPNVNIYSPCFYSELEALIEQTAQNNELCAIRYPRGCENKNFTDETGGDYNLVSNGGKKAIVTYGRIFSNAVEAVKKLEKTDIIKLNKIFPINEEVYGLLKNYDEIHFFEEGIKSGGIAEHMGSRLSEMQYKGKYTVHAIDGVFVPADNVSSALKTYGLDTQSMIDALS
ncbi:MAG: 1-deoxy-D-xylulose-5-phosphate synthase [Clostridia bacterium]|nr:1-deoxy-D-xylulose-5-phosphate synthase [Clostridia bacterium]